MALSFRAAGFRVLMTELPQPTAIRLTVCFAEAIYNGSHTVEGVSAQLATLEDWRQVVASGSVAVLVDPRTAVLGQTAPEVIVDATMTKANQGTTKVDGSVVVALGPGFTAGRDSDAVIETMRGHELGRIVRDGRALRDTGVPGEIGGRTSDRVLRAPTNGRVSHQRRIGDRVVRGELLLRVQDVPVLAPFDGCLRGAIHEGILVPRGMKIGDVDPRGDPSAVRTISDKARAVGRAALEAALFIGRERGLLEVVSLRAGGRGLR